VASWREIAAPIIAETVARVGRDDIKALRRALRDAYPFGERKYHPYKIWCDEVRRQLGLRKGPSVPENQLRLDARPPSMREEPTP
jgi:hypothetical protein